MFDKMKRNPERMILTIFFAQVILFGGVIGMRHMSGAGQPSLPPPRAIPPENLAYLRLNASEKLRYYHLVEFGDYQCPPCAKSHEQVRTLLKQHPEIVFHFRHMPLEQTHNLAMPAALLAESARRSGKFQEVNAALYSMDAELTKEKLKTLETRYSLSKPKSQEHETVASDIADAKRLGIDGTPTFVLCTANGKAFILNSLEQADDFLK